MAGLYPQLVLFGDSLLQRTTDLVDGYPMQAALQSRFIRRLDVVNRGFSGWNTANAVKYLPEIFPLPTESTPPIKYLVVLLGANDAVLPMKTTTQHVPLDQYKSNLKTIITHPNIQAHKPKILLVTPPPLDQLKVTGLDIAEGHASAIRTSATSAKYSEAAREVARETPGVVLIDFWKGIMDEAIRMAPDDYKEGGPWLGSPENGKQGGLDALLPDGLHLSGDAYRVLYRLLIPHMGQEWRNLADNDRAGYLFPDWRDLSPVAVEQ